MHKEFCKECRLYHVYIASIDKDESESMTFLDYRVQTSKEWVKESNDEYVINAAIRLMIDSQSLQNMWWDEITTKYKIDRKTHDYFIDFKTNQIYYKEEI